MPSISTLLHNRAVQGAIGIVVLILIGGVTYYLIESAPPKVVYATVTTGSIAESVTGTGYVTPVQNPTLSFEQGGQVVSVHAKVGEKVVAGTLLASLDTGVGSASLRAAEAALNKIESGPRGVDVAAQQTAVTNAQQTLNNTYANYPLTLNSTLSKAQEEVSTQVDPLFNMTNPSEPALSFNTNNYNNKITVDEERANLPTRFSAMQNEITSAGSNLTPSQIKMLTNDEIAALNDELTLLNNLVIALNDYQIGSITTTQQTADLGAVNQARDTLNGLISSLTAAGQAVVTQQLALQSAQDQLNQATAGATTQDIQAQQAQIAGIEAQIRQQEIIAPFTGTISSVSIKAGDVVSPNTPTITLVPSGNFEVDIYLAETDVTQLKVGDPADVTLDAYGTGRVFPATIASIDTSPSVVPAPQGSTAASGQMGYKVTLIFSNNDPEIQTGIHANVNIHSNSAQNVPVIPKSPVITNCPQAFVLTETSQGLVQVPIVTGISNATEVEVASGLSAGDHISQVGSQ